MSHKFIALSLVGLLFACGDHSSKNPAQNPALPTQGPGTETPVKSPAKPVDLKLYSAIQANFQGKFIGVSDGQLYNFDEEQKPTTAVQFTFANNQDASQTILSELPRRPQRIDIVNDDYVLLQRPEYHYQSGAPEYKTVEFAQDCYLINVKSGLIWKFDEYFPLVSSLQTVESGASKKLLFIGLKKIPEGEGAQGWLSIDLKKDYNYDTTKENGYSHSYPYSSKKTIISVDFSDTQQVTLRPISSGVEDIEQFIADPQGNVLAQTGWNSRRTLAIMQNDQTPTEVTINNAGFSNDSTYESRVVRDSKKNFWRFSRAYSATSNNYQVKAERLALMRDLDNRPALMPITTLSQSTVGYPSYRFDTNVWSSSYKSHELFAMAGILMIVNPDLTDLQLVTTDVPSLANHMQHHTSGIDVVNGKVLSYLKPFSGGAGYPSFLEYDLSDLSAPSVKNFTPDSKSVFGDILNITGQKTGGIALETLDGPTKNLYQYDGLSGAFTLEKSVRAETDNRVRILVPVTAID